MSAMSFASVDSAIYYMAWQLKMLPVYTLAAKVCPPGIEATLTALIAAVSDLSASVSQFWGSWLTSYFRVTQTDFSNIWLLYLVRTGCKLLPLPLVLLVPTDEKLDEAIVALQRTLEPLNALKSRGQEEDGDANGGEWDEHSD